MKMQLKISSLLAGVALAVIISQASLAETVTSDVIDPPVANALSLELAEIENNRYATVIMIVDQWRETMNAKEGTAGWEEELTAALEAAPADKLLAASKARSYDEVTAALFGSWQGPDVVVLEDGISPPSVLGSTTSDLVFTPVSPCRIIDTRIASGALAGRIGPNSGKQFQVNLANYSAQGGKGGSCGIPTGFEVTAVAINVASTNQTGAGHIRVIPTGGGVPLAALLNYNPGTNISNAAVVRTGLAVGNDLFIYSGFAETHVIVDIMGYFAAPVRTNPDSRIVESTGLVCANGSNCIRLSPTCPAGYRLTGGGYRTNIFAANVALLRSGPAALGTNTNTTWRCSIRNNSGGNISLFCSAVCLRVPGR